MNDSPRPAESKLSRLLRRLVLLACCAGVVGGLGCATAMVMGMPNSNAHDHYHKPVLADRILALGIPDTAMGQKIGNTNAIAFLGEKHTYLLLEGGAELNAIARQLDGLYLKLDDRGPRLYRKGKTIWGDAVLRYVPEAGGPPPEPAIARLTAAGFTGDDHGLYTRAVPVQGLILKPVKRDQLPPSSFQTPRNVAFFNPPDSRPPPDLGKLIDLPLAIAVDVVLSPLYLIGLVALSISMG